MKKCLFLLSALLLVAACAGPKVVRETVETESLVCEVTVYAPDVVRVVKYPLGGVGASQKKSYSVVLEPQKTQVKRTETEAAVFLNTGKIVASIDKATGDVTFYDAASGEQLLQEAGTAFEARPADDPDAGRFKVSQCWLPDADEFLYGLGQRQDQDLSLRGKKVHLWNENMHIYIPFFCSEKGYGVYWDNPGMSDFEDEPGGKTVMTSEVGDCSDLYFLYDGGSVDKLVALEHKLGGKATMFPLWVHGYWQCRERYHSTEELCEALRTHREMGIPLDCIVQDWQYWGENENWNSMRFDNPLYERGDTMIANVHNNHAHLAISIWPDFGPLTPQFKELEAIGALLPFKTWPMTGGVKIYDPFNPQAREIYWKYLEGLVDQGVDALWSDSTEPDHFYPIKEDDDYRTADGTWRSVRNAFPLVTNMGIYNNYRAKGYAKRAVQMTRSASFGIQRYATFSWSGDVQSRWNVLRAQIPSGLDYTICGIPYWNTDIGGFFNWFSLDAVERLRAGDAEPYLRTAHDGDLPLRRAGRMGLRRAAQRHQAPLQADALHLFPRRRDRPGRRADHAPAGDGLREGPQGPRPQRRISVRTLHPGPSGHGAGPDRRILVHPVTEPVLTDGKAALTGATAAPFTTYLPAGTAWYDFQTGECLEGGREYTREYTISEIPVFVKAGAILPFGPDVQYTSEKPWDSLELAIYPGADGHFTLYEDAGDGYEYEKGEYTTIDLSWNDKQGSLTIGPRQGTFPGMLRERDFVVKVPGREPRTVHYKGKRVHVRL